MVQSSEAEPKPNVLRRIWNQLDLSPVVVLMMIKGALPSTIALAAYESHAFSSVYTTLGYLVAIMAHLSMAIQPRAKFMQSTTINVVFICLGAAVALLMIKCTIAARHPPQTEAVATGSSGSQESLRYDSSANAVAAVFQFVLIFISNCIRAARPQLMMPMIQFSIFAVVASTYAPSFPTMSAGYSFVQKLLISFLTAYAIATAVSLFFLPVTSRKSVSKQIGALMGIYKGCLSAHSAYMVSVTASAKTGEKAERVEKAGKLKELVTSGGALFGKIKLEIGFARKEIAFGKLKPEHYSEIFEGLREILQPIMGLATFLGIVETLKEHKGTLETVESGQMLKAIKALELEEWDAVMTISRDAYANLQKAMFQGLDHIGYQLEILSRPKKEKNMDVEEKGANTPEPGDPCYADHLEKELIKYQAQRNEVIQHWAESRQVILPRRFWPAQHRKETLGPLESRIARSKINQHQLYLILYINFLVYSTGQAILKQARFADRLVKEGIMSRNRLILPGWKRLHRLFSQAFRASSSDETLSADANAGTNVYLGDGLKGRKDPEHLPPSNVYERFTNYVRIIPRCFASEAVSFGFRAAIAALSLGIVAYLKSTRNFFLEQRGLWAIIMTSIAMAPQSGQSVFGYITRIFGTAIAMVVSIIIWYMCDKNHAAVIVIFGIQTCFWILFIIKKPQYAVVGIISSVTVILILGYELQVDVLGIQAATANGQIYYPVYLLAPYRTVAVCIGIGVAFIWTFFPYPLTTHGSLRRDTGSALYILANFYSVAHTTLDARLHMGPAINGLPSDHPVKKLDAARKKTFGKTILMLTRLREYYNFTKWEPPIGGKFPLEQYDALITSISNVFTYLSLIVYSSQSFIREPNSEFGMDGHVLTEEEAEEERRWLTDFRDFAASNTVTSHSLTSTLCLLSASLRNSQPLPPYLSVPKPLDVPEKLDEIDPELLGVQHFAHPCYAAFAVGEVASAFVTAEITKITRLIKELVGEVDFSFHIVSTNVGTTSTNDTFWGDGSSSGSARSRKMKGS